MTSNKKISRKDFFKNLGIFVIGIATLFGICPKILDLFSFKDDKEFLPSNIKSPSETFTSETFLKEISNWFVNTHSNSLPNNIALPDEFRSKRIFETPLFGIGDANDSMFKEFAQSKTIGTQIIIPNKQLANAKSVIVVFAPFVKDIRKENANNPIPDDIVWRTAYYFGEKHLIKLALEMKKRLESYGYEAKIPSWSHRHIGFICGLGSFGLAKHLITEKGGCGRMISLITTAPFNITKRTYTEIYEHCDRCKGCENMCPAGAIDFKKQDHYKKNHNICRQYFTCGKCQVNVPCEHSRP